MNIEEYERMYRLEDSYWWFVGRHQLVQTFMRAAYGARKDLTILDIGCGTGAMSIKLAPWGRVVSADFSPLALAPIVWLARKLLWRKSAQPQASLVHVPGLLNRLLVGLIAAENALVRRMRLPFGVTVFCMAERP